MAFHRQGEEPLRDDEISILNGVLELNTKKVEDIMTPITVSIALLATQLQVVSVSHTWLQDAMSISADAILDHSAVDTM